MGSYLAKPVVEKESSDESNHKLAFGASSMQGWRVTQEDAHNCILDYDTNTAYFGVYDGHGGHEVALYCSQHLPDIVKNTDEYKEGKIDAALIKGFLEIDGKIATAEVVAVLTELAKDKHDDSDSDDEENVNNLYEEAAMPIEQVIEKYTNKGLKGLKKDEQHAKSPCLKAKKDGEATVDSSAGCSKNEPDMPDSCGDGVSSSTETEKKEATTKDAAAPSSNGDAAPSVADSEAQAKEEADATSSTVENGEVSKKGKGKAIKKPVAKPERPKRNAQKIYKEWLHSEEDSDGTDEEDQTFQGPEESSDDNEDDSVNVAIEAGSDDSSEEEEEEEEDLEEEDEEFDEEGGVFLNNTNTGPGMESGCTAVVALLKDDQLYVANAGDSRCIISRNGKAVEMSFDHKPEDDPERERITKAGGFVTVYGRVDGGLNVSRAIGDHMYKQNKELSDREQMITALPDIKQITLNPEQDEFMVLACDGIWNYMSSQEVVDFIRPHIDKKEKLSDICEMLFDHCLAPDTMGDGTGCDNMTAILVKFKGNTISSSAAAKRPASPSQGNESKRSKTEEDESDAQVDTTA